ncbi:MAG TPA: type II secretion system F family protein [Candidatus Saccharimonadales bacterium]|nr:type II secretion system F family protein [Candidatus Saccharimonadales bacterium]
MPQFNYTSIATDGHQISGLLTAPTREEALAELRKNGGRPLMLREVKAKKQRISFKNKAKLKDIVIFSRELSTMISAGVPLPRALETLAEQTENKYFKEVILNINHDVESGTPLADALGKHPNVFNEVYVNMVRAGEAGGILDDIMKRLATQVEKDATIRHKIRGAMAYPVVILTVTIIAFFGIMLFIIPKIGKIIKDLGGPNAQLPVYTRAMLSISNFLQHNIIFILPAAFISLYLFRRYIRTEKGKYWWHGVLLRTPILGKVLVKIAVARFSRTFASLMSSGVNVLESLQITGKAVGNRVIQRELEEVAKAVKNGHPLGKQLLASKYFPPIVGQMMSVGEETGKIDEILVKVADFYEEEVDTVIDSLASIIEPLMIVVLGALVGMIAASVMGPIAGLSKQIGS